MAMPLHPLLATKRIVAFDAYGTRGALGWSLEQLNELRLYRATGDRGSGYTTVLGGDDKSGVAVILERFSPEEGLRRYREALTLSKPARRSRPT